ncbi:tetratricopeptide repeat-containing sensor histidine kinase [Acinetobacter sp.]|uniref:tetratricopeptide repeat-containing sensor histidine kinase n=1 Tax=Acinetobacter sp. TaxID=472 RepID=UPI003CFE8DC9
MNSITNILRNKFFFFSFFISVFCSVPGLSKDIDFSKGIESEDTNILFIDSLNNESRELMFINPSKSLELAQKALSTSENYKKGIAYAYRNIANINFLYEVFNLGIDYLKMAEEIFVTLNDTVGLADCYISYGFMYRNLHNIPNEVLYFEKAYQLYKSRSMPDRLGVSALNLAQSYFTSNQYIESRKLVEEAIVLNEKTDQFAVLSMCYKLLGELEIKERKNDLAAEYFFKVLEINSKQGQEKQIIATIETQLNLSELAQSENNSEQQLYYLKEALELVIQYNLTEHALLVYNKLIMFYLNDNRVTEAKQFLLEFNEIKESIDISRRKDKLLLVNKLIEAFNLGKQNELLEKTNQLQNKGIRARNILLIVIVVFAFSIFLVLINLNKVKRRVKQQNIWLQNQNSFISNQKKELDDLLLARDRLLSIIAHDLRNPFNSMLLTMELMKVDNDDKENVLNHLNRLEKTARATYELLEKLLLWARNQKENINTEKTALNLYNVVNEAIEDSTDSAYIKKIELVNQVFSDLTAFADKNMLLTILRNLIQNSIKFTNEGGSIRINVSIR